MHTYTSHSQEHFEGDGAGRYFQPPAFALPFALEETSKPS